MYMLVIALRIKKRLYCEVLHNYMHLVLLFKLGQTKRITRFPETPPQNTYVGQLETKQSPYSLPTAEGILNDMSA